MIVFTHLTSLFPKKVSKVYGLNPDGTLRKGETSANISEAAVKTVSVAIVREFSEVVIRTAFKSLSDLRDPHRRASSKLVTKKRWNSLGKPRRSFLAAQIHLFGRLAQE